MNPLARTICGFWLVLLGSLSSCDHALVPEPGEELSAGPGTIVDDTRDAFTHHLPGLERDLERSFLRGRPLFRDNWVTAPASTDSRDGLGPLFNARSCEACHVRDGRGRPPWDGEPFGSLLFRLSVPGASADEPPVPEPTYGGQLQPLAIQALDGEGTPQVTYEEQPGQFADGQDFSLRTPRYTFTDLSHGPMVADVQVSPRVAPALIGLGLLEAVPQADIEALADPDDSDGDGISGRANYVIDVTSGELALGRFGLKSNQPTILQQVAGAFVGDIGITSALFVEESCTGAQADCGAAISGGDPELLDAILADVTFYSRALAVPIRRNWDAQEVLRGKQIFRDIGCASCHVPTLTTGDIPDLLGFSNITIRPYTDLLVHDMGSDLADDRPDFGADGREWRTPPLWGLGLIEAVNGHLYLLHDGRARGHVEAIMWHGGEAEDARAAFASLSAVERAELVAFLESL